MHNHGDEVDRLIAFVRYDNSDQMRARIECDDAKLRTAFRSLLADVVPIAHAPASAPGGSTDGGQRNELLSVWTEARQACRPNTLPNGVTVHYDDERVERFAAYALHDGLIPSLIADANRLDWWELHLRYEHQQNLDPEEISDGVVDFYRVNGNVNDLEREHVGAFDSLRDAIDAAMSKEPSHV